MLRFHDRSRRIAALAICLLALSAVAPGAEYTKEDGIVYAQPDGKALKGTLYCPKAAMDGGHPAMVLLHGGAFVLGSRRLLSWYGEQFASHGYVAFAVDYRLMPKYAFPAPLEDAQHAVAWLRGHASEYGIDPSRIGVFGESAGGHLAALLGTKQEGADSAVQAVVSFYGMGDLVSFRTRPDQGLIDKALGEYLDAFVGRKSESGAKALESASPVAYLNRDTCPMLLVHGVDDHIVPVAQSRELYERLRAQGIPATLVQIPGRGHAFDRLHHHLRSEVFAITVAFLDRWLEVQPRDMVSAGEQAESGG